MPTNTDTRDALRDCAHALGAEAGKAAASWYFDGNTPRETYAHVLEQLEAGDPAVYDTFPTCPLSGEWADDPTPGSVLRTLGVDEYDDANDDLLRMYEDGFGVAVADTIEAAARAALAEEDETERTPRDLARLMAARFTRKVREDGTEYVTLSDAADEWMTDVVREAHAGMLPDDWRYDVIAAAVELIADDEGWEDDRSAWVDGMVDVYSSALIEWLGSHPARVGYVDEAQETWYAAGTPIMERIGLGQYVEADEVLGLVAGALQERC